MNERKPMWKRNGDNRGHRGRMGWRLAVTAGVLMLLLTGCVGEAVQNDLAAQCSEKRLKLAMIVYEDAKNQYMEHMQTRSDSALNMAFQTAADSIRVAKSSRYCTDFTDKIKARATDIILSNKYLQVLTVTTMRDADPGVAISIFGDKYREIFKNDIN